MCEPLVTVCLPVFNDEKTVGLAVESILNQTYDKLEILISDNQSEDRTYEILQEYDDHRINLTQNNSNSGWRGNSNKLLKKAKGEYIVTLHGDDYYQRTDYIEKVVKIFNENSSVGIIHFIPEIDTVQSFGGQGIIDKKYYLHRISSVKYMPAPTVTAYRKEALLLTQYYAKHYWSGEVRLSIEMALAGYNSYIEGDASYFYRYQGPEKDSSIPLRRSGRLGQLYSLYKDLSSDARFEFNKEEFEETLLNEIFLLNQNQHIDFILESLRRNIALIFKENIVSSKLINSINELIVRK